MKHEDIRAGWNVSCYLSISPSLFEKILTCLPHPASAAAARILAARAGFVLRGEMFDGSVDHLEHFAELWRLFTLPRSGRNFPRRKASTRPVPFHAMPSETSHSERAFGIYSFVVGLACPA